MAPARANLRSCTVYSPRRVLLGEAIQELKDVLIGNVITSYSIHYTKLYEGVQAAAPRSVASSATAGDVNAAANGRTTAW